MHKALVVPGLKAGNSVGFATTHLRGIGSTALGPGIENPIAIYVDGVYYASAESSLFDFLNLDSVEVLKGPQGTLFGRNATGGLIQVITREPTQDTRIDADIGFANYQAGRADFYLGGGLAPNLAADLAVQVSGAGEGYGRNFYNGKEVYRNDLSINTRSKVVWTPSELTKLTASFDFSSTRNSLAPQTIVPGASPLPALVDAPYYSARGWDINENVQPETANQSGGTSVRLDQDAGIFNVMDIVAYRRGETKIQFDLDATAAANEGTFPYSYENQFSEELQLSSKPGDNIRWATGLYYFHSGAQYDPARIEVGQSFFYPAPPAVYPFATILDYGDQTADSYAGYGQASFPLGAQTNLTTGIRYTDETHFLRGSEQFLSAGGAVVPIGATFPRASATFKAPTYRLALDHHFTEDFLLYVSWNTGFKSGGFNTQSYTDGPYQPEKLFAYEVGAKTEFLDHKIRINIAGFHDKYKDIQVQHVEGASTAIINGASATLYGADLDFEARLFSQFTISGSAEVLHAVYDSFPNAPTSNPDLAITEPTFGGDAAGHHLGYAAPEQFTIAGDYSFPLPSGELDLNVTVNHSASFFTEPDNVIRQPDYTKVNASLRWKAANDRYDVLLWGRNLTNAAVFTYADTLGTGLHVATYEPPRTYGVTFGYHYK